jgi:hypothetical protein
MATVVLSAGSEERPALREVSGGLAGELRRAGETDVRTFELATTPLAYCQGEFDCWVKTPRSPTISAFLATDSTRSSVAGTRFASS